MVKIIRIFFIILIFTVCSTTAPLLKEKESPDFTSMNELVEKTNKIKLTLNKELSSEMTSSDAHVYIDNQRIRTAVKLFSITIEKPGTHRVVLHTSGNAFGFKTTFLVPALDVYNSNGIPVVVMSMMRKVLPPTMFKSVSFFCAYKFEIQSPGEYVIAVSADLTSNDVVNLSNRTLYASFNVYCDLIND
jgi:hypothetical protein